MFVLYLMQCGAERGEKFEKFEFCGRKIVKFLLVFHSTCRCLATFYSGETPGSNACDLSTGLSPGFGVYEALGINVKQGGVIWVFGATTAVARKGKGG